MASTYGYSTIVKLELYSSEDYGTIDATYLTDPHVEAKITSGERKINTYLGKTFTGTIPDGVIDSTNIIATRLIYRWMLTHNFKLSKNQQEEALKPLLDDDVKILLDVYKGATTPIKLHRFYNNNPAVFY